MAGGSAAGCVATVRRIPLRCSAGTSHMSFARVLLIVLFFCAPAVAQSDELQDRFRRAAELQRQGAFQEAANEYRALLERAPNYAEAQANFGVVLARLGKYDEAVRAYETALRLNPSLTFVLLNVGILHYRAGQFAKAIGPLEQFDKLAPGNSPGNSQARQLLGSSLVELGRDAEAITYLEPLANSREMEATSLYSLGLAYLRLHRQEVMTVSERLKARPNGEALAHLLQGQIHLEAFAFEKAVAELESIKTELPRQQFLLGVAYHKLGRNAEARKQFEGELKRSPDDFLTLYYLALVLDQLGDSNAARERIESALKQEPNSAEALALAGGIALKQGNATDAVRFLEQAVERQPENTETRFQLARAYQKLGRKADAAREFAEVQRRKARKDQR